MPPDGIEPPTFGLQNRYSLISGAVRQSLTTGKTHWKARAVTVGSTIAGTVNECGSGSDSVGGPKLPEPPAQAGLGFDRAVLFWDSAVNDSLKCSGTN